ncbi:MAG: crossover junction endodeoxyribonuclease RuvC [Candidatus Levybacteria bacterium RBG_16_35_11]|nr:MAG: crossover junction endodeoxyribonuclease RuvC [Candidatus Levybacteria bacterium RBG_16_35_11]
MRVLGIDPGTARTGWAVLEKKKGEIIAVAFNCFETKKEEEVAQRLEKIFAEIKRLIKEYTPQIVAIEEVFFSANAKTAFAVGQARGVIFLASQIGKVKSCSYTPLQIKKTVTGYGRAEKKQMGEKVKSILNLQEIPKFDDTCDALAVALTHLYLNGRK